MQCLVINPTPEIRTPSKCMNPQCRCHSPTPQPDSEDDAIEKIEEEFKQLDDHDKFHIGDNDWLRIALRSYGDEREAAVWEKGEDSRAMNVVFHKSSYEKGKQEGRAEFTRELLEKMPKYADIDINPIEMALERMKRIGFNQGLIKIRSLLESESKGL